MIDYSDAQIIIQVYIDKFNQICDKYDAGEENAEIGYCNKSRNMLNSILKALKLLDDLDKLEKMHKDIFIGVEFLELLSQTNVDNELIEALLKDRGDFSGK